MSLFLSLALSSSALSGATKTASRSSPSEKGATPKTPPTAPPAASPIPGWHRTPARVLFSDLETLVQGERNEAPEIISTSEGILWTAWVNFDAGRERIMLRRRSPEDSDWSPQIILLGEGQGPTGRPRMASSGETLWVTWAEILDQSFEIRVARLEKNKLEEVFTLSEGNRPALRPSIAVDAEGIPWVAWEEFGTHNIRIMVQRLSSRRPSAFSPSGNKGLNQRPCLSKGPKGTMLLAWDRYVEGRYDLRLARLAPSKALEVIDITRDGWLDQAPNLFYESDKRTWLAWHTNRPPGHEKGYAGRRLELIALEEGGYRRLEAGAPPPVFIKEMKGVPDVLEFPTILMSHAGRLYLFSRRGQGYIGMSLEGKIWRPPFDLSETGWGGRGREIRAAVDRRGNLHVVARWLHRVARRVIQPPPGRPKKIRLHRRVLSFPYAPSEERFHPRTPGEAAQKTASFTPSKNLERSSLRPSQGGFKTQDPMQTWYFGDLHTHSWLSDGCGDPDEVFTRSRDILGLDFVALTDHDVSNGNRLAPHEWAYISLLTAFFNEPGQFVTIPAYEWTSPPTAKGGFGHRNIYFESPPPDIFGVDEEAPDTMHLFELIQKSNGFSIPHHTSWTGTDWAHFDPVLQPLFEIISLHGNSERPGAYPIPPREGESATYAVDGLKAGRHFGFVGGSDGHGVPWHYGISRRENVWTTGLTGVSATSLDRNALLSALRKRRTIATSGIRTTISLRLGRAQIGDQLDFRGKHTIPALLQGYADVNSVLPLARVEWIRDGQILSSWPVRGGEKAMAARFTLRIEPGSHAYYLRVVHRNGDMAWSSPITIHIPSTAKPSASTY